VTQGLKTCQVALRFGANDVGSVMLEGKRRLSRPGRTTAPRRKNWRRLIRDAGFIPKQRDSFTIPCS